MNNINVRWLIMKKQIIQAPYICFGNEFGLIVSALMLFEIF